MKIRICTLNLFVAATLTGCGSTWVNLDSSKASKDKIASAEIDCQVVEKIRELQTKEMTIDLMKINAETDEAKEELDKVYQNSERMITAEIDECMRSQGLVRAE